MADKEHKDNELYKKGWEDGYSEGFGDGYEEGRKSALEEMLEEENKRKKEVEDEINNYELYPLLKDVIANKELKQELEFIVQSIKQPSIYEAFGVQPEKSFLLQGAPGTGKTFTVRAIINQLVSDGINTMYYPYDIGTYGTAYINMGSVNLQNYFDNGRKVADKGIVVFYVFDECESLLGKRGMNHNHKEDDKLLNTLMKNLQEINNHGEREYVFFMTNFPELLDPAAVRGKRINKVLNYDLPDKSTLKEALEYYVNLFHVNAQREFFRIKNYDKIVSEMDSFNFADVQEVVEGTIRSHIRKNILSSKKPKLYISERDLVSYVVSYRKSRKQLKKDVNKPRIGFV